MATTAKKTAKKPKQRNTSLKETNAKLVRENDHLRRERDEALEQQAATSEILQAIAGSPTEIQPVLDAVAESAARLCESYDAQIYRVEGDIVRKVASHGIVAPVLAVGETRPIDRAWLIGRALLQREPIHIHDSLAVLADDYAEVRRADERLGIRTLLAVPLLREGVPIGAIMIRRTEVRPFTDKQINLLKTFADQAVIAIENVRLFQELKEALEQQTAMSSILSVIASSPTDIQPVLNTVASSVTRLCDASDAVIIRLDGSRFYLAAHSGTHEAVPLGSPMPFGRGLPAGRAVLERTAIVVADMAEAVESEFPEAKTMQRRYGYRSVAATPLLREEAAVGALVVMRTEVRPFTEKQVALLKTFADQAVIAIENVRLFRELAERNAELREALEHQTATAEVLGIISRSPTDVQLVLDAIVESAARVCGIDDVHLRLRAGNMMVSLAHFGPIPILRAEIPIDESNFLWIRDHGTLHVPDVGAQKEFQQLASERHFHTHLSVPLRQQSELIGLMNARRTEVRPFTPTQIKLLETFADQAVIAIENVRLFQELKESLEQQTATSEILGVIASSPTDIQLVLDTVAQNAARLCDATDAQVQRIEGNYLRTVASYGSMSAPNREERRLVSPGHAPSRAVIERQTLHIHDLAVEVASKFPESAIYQERFGTRTLLCAPLLREGEPLGLIVIRRTEVRPFTEKQIKLLETFASQAVIAIENVRLFKELENRNRQLTEALEQQTATSEILRVIASSPTDIQPVLDVVAESAARLCEASDANIYRMDGAGYRLVASYGSMPIPDSDKPRPLIRGLPPGRAMIDRAVVDVDDMLSPEAQADFPEGRTFTQAAGLRTLLVAPLLREGVAIGAIFIRRTEVRPFTDKQIALLKTFADQAVIAIENVRLFQELQERTRELVESVEEMKALSEVGQAVGHVLISL